MFQVGVILHFFIFVLQSTVKSFLSRTQFFFGCSAFDWPPGQICCTTIFEVQHPFLLMHPWSSKRWRTITGEGVCMMIKKTLLLEKLISHEATNGG